MSDSKRTTTSERPKYMSKKVCEICGAKFMGGPRAGICSECRPLYTRRHLTLYKRLHMAGAAPDAAIRAEAIEWVRAMRKIAPEPESVPAPAARTTCGYCGRELGPRDARRGYCARCVARGFHWIHEVTGRTREGGAMKYREPRPRTCPDCGATFMARSHMQKRCPACQREAFLARKRRNSLRNYYAHRRMEPLAEIVCASCGKKFVPRSRRQKKFCSELCANRDAGARWRRRNGVKARGAATAAAVKTGGDSKRTTARDWMAQVEFDLQIQDPTERYEASRAWSARQRAYARKLALRAIGWRGSAY